MSANSPIRAVPHQVAEPSYFIQRFLRSVQPFYHQHAQYGQEYFERSRRTGDVLLPEDWDLALQFSPELTNSALPNYQQANPIVAPSLPSSSLLGTQPVARQHSSSPGPVPVDNSSGHGKQTRPRTGNALRTAPYARRPKEAAPVQYPHHASPASPSSNEDLGDNRRHTGAGQERRVVSADDNVRAYCFADFVSQSCVIVLTGFPDIALLKQQYNERRRRSSEEQQGQVLPSVTVPDSSEKRNRASRPPDLDFGHQKTRSRSIQAEAGRLTLHPVAAPPADVQHPRGIFLRGVASHPVAVSQPPPVPDANARAGSSGFNQLRFLGVNDEAQQQQQHYQQHHHYPSTLAASNQALPQASKRTAPPDVQLPPLRTLDADAHAPRYRETVDQTPVWQAERTTPPHDAAGYASYPPYGDHGREITPPTVTVTPEVGTASYWETAYPTAARQSHVLELQRQQQQYQQYNTNQVHSPYHQPPFPTNDYAAYPYASWANAAYPTETTTMHRRSGGADRAVSADLRRYDDTRSWDRPFSAPPPLGRESSHLLNAIRGEPPAPRPRPTQWPSAPIVQQSSQGSPPRDNRKQWTPVGPEIAHTKVAGTSDWPEPITVPGSSPTSDPSPTSSHFQVPYTPQPYAAPLFPVPTAACIMPPTIGKQAPPVDMYHTTAMPFY